MNATHFPPSTQFCALCGTHVEQRIPADDTRVRAVCPACGHVHYDNPKMVVCTITTFKGKVLLCQRAIEPAHGKWTLPGGFMECGESTMQGALRETFEEACATVRLVEPVYHIVDIPHIAQTHLFFRAELETPEFGAGDETLQTRLFAPEEIPWEDLVFRSSHSALRTWMADVTQGVFPTRHVTLSPLPDWVK
jgi:ADP-ribose pyrophosphatase YjhB (NUDIX family)